MIGEAQRRECIALIEEAVAAGARRERACEAVGLSHRSYQRWTREGGAGVDGRVAPRRGGPPKNKLSEAERQRILAICNSPEHASRPPSQIVPLLADSGVFLASEATFHRLLRAANQAAPRGPARPPKPRPRAFCARGPRQVWSWDITYLPSAVAGRHYRLYMIMDIYSRKIVGWEVHDAETAEHAARLIQRACLAEGVQRGNLVLHSDNGAPMKALIMIAKLQRLGVMPSFGRPAVSNDNAYSEALFGSLKRCPIYPSRPFRTLGEARRWVLGFAHWYNAEHLHSALNFITPADRHDGRDFDILKRRKAVYEAARNAQPKRWSGNVRNWEPAGPAWLNPDRDSDISADHAIVITADHAGDAA